MTAAPPSPPADLLTPPPADLHLETACEIDAGPAGPARRFMVGYGESRLVQLSETALWLLTAARDELPVAEAAAQLTTRTGLAASGADIHRYYRTVIDRLAAVEAAPPRRPARSAGVTPALLVRARRVRAVAARLLPLFRPAVVGFVTAVSLAVIVLACWHGLHMTARGGLAAAYGLALLAVVVHEFGHAAAALYRGAQPGDMRLAVGLSGPRFGTDVTAAWRLPKSGRVAVDLGGPYLQTVVAAGYAAAYLITGWPVLATALVLTLTFGATSLVPVWNSDGAWAVADLIGSRSPAAGPGMSRGRRSRAARILVVLRRLFLVALVAYLAAGGWRLVAGLPTAAWRLWLGENGSALSVALITVVITLTGPAARAAGSRLWPATRQAREQGAPDAESGAVLAGGERHPGTGQECTTAPGGARSSPAPPAAGTVATRVGEVLESFLREQEGTLAEIDTGLSEMTAPLVRLLLGGGKRLRPLFCYWGWRGAGQPDCAAIIAAAAAFELLHGCALVHDDVMDDSGTRRGLPTMHRHFAALHGQRGWRGDAAGFGTAAAILLGDLCLSWSDELLDRSGLDDQRLGPARRLFWRTRTELIGGQYLDIQTQAAGGLDLRHAGQVARYKTSKYTIERPLQIGALLAGAPPDLLAAYSAYALPLGEAFQLRDDLLGVFGDPARTGKPAGDDLRAGKPTALICLTAELANASGRAAISRLLGRPDLGQADLDQLREIIVETGAPARVEAMICSRLELTLSALDQAFPDDPVSRQALSHLAVLATDRIQ